MTAIRLITQEELDRETPEERKAREDSWARARNRDERSERRKARALKRRMSKADAVLLRALASMLENSGETLRGSDRYGSRSGYGHDAQKFETQIRRSDVSQAISQLTSFLERP